MRYASAIIIKCLILSLLFAAWVIPVSAQEDNDSLPASDTDTVFNEILLSGNRVIAIDISGYEWYYDFEKNTFVMGSPEDSEIDEVEEPFPDIETEYIPIEERCTVEKKIKSFEKKSITIGTDEYVDGDINAWGRVTVKGWVKGDIKSYQKRVLVTSTGQVDGNIEAPSIVIKDGGVVLGEIIEEQTDISIDEITSSFSTDGIIVVISLSALFLFASFILIALMPRQIKTFQDCCKKFKYRSYFLGLLFLLLMPVVVTVVTITIVGIVLVPFIPFIYMFAIVMGVISFGDRIGYHLYQRFTGREKHMILQSATGIVLLMALWLAVAVLLGASDDVSQGFGIFFLVVAIIISTVPLCTGIGSAILTRFGFRTYLSWRERQQQRPEPETSIPAPPPIPQGNAFNGSDNPFKTPGENKPPPPEEPPKSPPPPPPSPY